MGPIDRTASSLIYGERMIAVMKLNFMSGAILALIFFSGCSFQAPLHNADHGQYPTQYEDAVKRYFDNVLFDPFSASYKIGTPQKAYANDGLMFGGDVIWYGYVIDVWVNAKNRYGGYVGYKHYLVKMRDGKVVDPGSSLVHRVQ
jgi:hypothetical protein